jgi:hypothetical protein
MRIFTRSLLLVGLLGVAACATRPAVDAEGAAARNCDAVRCAACPEGQHPTLKPPDCCKCVADK